MDSNTKLLLRFDGTIEDNSLNRVPITNNGVIASTTQSKFGGYSGYFNGGQYININSSDLPDFNFDWTIDWWEYRTQTYNDTASVFNLTNGVYNSDRGILVGYTMNSSISVYIASPTTQWDIASGASMGSVLVNQWVHRALVKNGNNYYTFQNGSLITTFSSTLSIRTDLTVGSIGNYANGLRYLFAYVDNFRISDIARWTSNFTVPTEEDYKNNVPLYIKQKGFWIPVKKVYRKDNNSWTELEGSDVPNYITSSSTLKPKYLYTWKKSKTKTKISIESDNNTLLLLKGTDLKDYSSNNFAIENHGVIQNNGSLYFDGNSYLKIGSQGSFNFSVKDERTFEIWVDHESISGLFYYFGSNTINSFRFGSNNGKFIVDGLTDNLSSSITFSNPHELSTNKLYHIKLTYDYIHNNKTREIVTAQDIENTIYIDGEKFGVEEGVLNTSGPETLLIGANVFENTLLNSFKGYIEAIRISNFIRTTDDYTSESVNVDLGYVTSDNPNKYPSNGLAADGCYYERV